MLILFRYAFVFLSETCHVISVPVVWNPPTTNVMQSANCSSSLEALSIRAFKNGACS